MTSAGLSNLRSLLFAPGSDERKLTRALESDADGVVADLEDAVAAAEKDAARSLVVRLMGSRETKAARRLTKPVGGAVASRCRATGQAARQRR